MDYDDLMERFNTVFDLKLEEVEELIRKKSGDKRSASQDYIKVDPEQYRKQEANQSGWYTWDNVHQSRPSWAKEEVPNLIALMDRQPCFKGQYIYLSIYKENDKWKWEMSLEIGRDDALIVLAKSKYEDKPFCMKGKEFIPNEYKETWYGL